LYKAKITAAAFHVPARVVTNVELEEILDTTDSWIQARTGIRQRHHVAKGEATSDLAAAAARKALAQRGINAAEIDCIIVATVTPDMFFPSTACLVQEKIGAVNAWGFDLSGACAGFVFACATASQFVHSGAYKRILVIGGDVMSSIINPKDRGTYVLFGDAAGAVIFEPTESGEEGVIDFVLRIDGSGGQFLRMPAGGSLKPATIETVQQNLHFVQQDGRSVFKYAVQKMAEISKEVLDRNRLTAADLTLFAPHQANQRIVDATVEKLRLDPAKCVRNIDRYANTTAATIPIGLAESYQEGRLAKGDLVLIASVGAGFTLGSLLLRWAF
jgi:3-oxoacyl-[acyl-carrier-protein] synthase-3